MTAVIAMAINRITNSHGSLVLYGALELLLGLMLIFFPSLLDSKASPEQMAYRKVFYWILGAIISAAGIEKIVREAPTI